MLKHYGEDYSESKTGPRPLEAKSCCLQGPSLASSVHPLLAENAGVTGLLLRFHRGFPLLLQAQTSLEKKEKRKRKKKRKGKKKKRKEKKRKMLYNRSSYPAARPVLLYILTNLLLQGSTAWAASRPLQTRLGQGIQLRNEAWGPDIRIVVRGIFPDRFKLLCHFAGLCFRYLLDQADTTLISKRIIVHVGFFLIY